MGGFSTQIQWRENHDAIVYILGWYVFSLSISVYNKWMFGDGLKFEFPIFVTAFHQMCLMGLSLAVLWFMPLLRPKINTNGQVSGRNVRFKEFCRILRMGMPQYIRLILPCAVASAGDIGLSNVSFKFISLSLYTMLKTTSLIFVLLFGLLFRLEMFHWRLVVIVVVMTFSVMMMMKRPSSATDQGKSITAGIFMVIGASVMSGLRWLFTQLLLKENQHTTNPISTILYLSPAMCLTLFIFGIMFEGLGSFTLAPIWEVKGIFTTIILMLIPSVLAFMMTVCEFKLLSVAQVLTLSIAGIFKEMLTIAVGSIVFGDKLSAINCLGLAITFLDILWYNFYRYNENRGDFQKNYTHTHISAEAMNMEEDDIGLEFTSSSNSNSGVTAELPMKNL